MFKEGDTVAHTNGNLFTIVEEWSKGMYLCECLSERGGHVVLMGANLVNKSRRTTRRLYLGECLSEDTAI